jgi:hypothetical protein
VPPRPAWESTLEGLQRSCTSTLLFIYKFWLMCGSHCDYFVFVYLSQASGSHRDDIAPVDVDGFLNTSGGALNNNPHTHAE